MEHEIAQLAQALRAQNEQNAKMMGMFGRMASANSSPNDQRKMERDLFSKPADRFNQNVNSMRSSIDQWNRAMYTTNRASEKVSSSLKLLGQDASAAQNALSGMAKTLLGGALGGVVIGGLINYVSGLTKTYQSMAEIGQTFGGNLFKMSEAAAQSYMTLERYSEVMKANSEIAAQMNNRPGGSGFGQFLGQVRAASKDMGMFGFTMEGLDEVAITYMENLKAQGHLQSMSNNQAMLNVRQMASEVTAMSAVYGKSRAEILKTTKEGMAVPSIQARHAQMSADQAEKANAVINSAFTNLAGLPGDVGKLMTETMSQLYGARGNLGMVNNFKTVFAKMGVSADHFVDANERLEKAVRNNDHEGAAEAMDDLIGKLRATGQENMKQLEYFASLGDMYPELSAAASKMIQIATIPDLTPEQKKQRKEEALRKSEETRLALNASQKWNEISSMARLALLPLISEPMTALAKSLKEFQEGPGFKDFQENIKLVSGELSRFATTLFSGENMKVFGEWLGSLAIQMRDFVGSIDPKAIKKTLADLESFGKTIWWLIGIVGSLASGLISMVSMLKPVFSGLGTIMEKFGIGAKEVVLGLGALYVGMKALKAYSFLRGIGKMNVTAANVNIEGKGIADIFNRRNRNGRGRGGGGGTGGGGRMRRMGRGIAGAAVGLGGLVLGGLELLNGPVADKLSTFGEALFGAKKGAEAAADGASTASVKGKTDAPKAPEVKTGVAADAAKGAAEAESAASKGLRASKLLKSLGVLGTVLSTIDGGMQVYDLNERSKAEGWDDNKFREELTKLLAPMLTGTAGALAGGALGAAGGSLIAPGIGSIIGGVGGAIGGGMGGDKLGEMIAPLIVDAIKKAPIGAVNTGEQFGPPIPANLKSPNEIDPAAVSKKITEYMSSLEEMRRTDGINNEKLLEQLTKVAELIRQQTEMEAQLLNRNNETVKYTANDIRRATESNGN